jgi:gluconate 5-dehydrogenase
MYIWDLSVEEYRNVLDVHLIGDFALTKRSDPMKESVRAHPVSGEHDSYIGSDWVAATLPPKRVSGLIHTLTRSWRVGITVNAIAPG